MRRFSRSLGLRLALSGLAVFAGMGALQFLALGYSSRESFGRIEDRISLDHAMRARMAVVAEEETLRDLVRENALWDDMYEITRQGQGERLTSLLPPAWLELSGLDLIILRGENGRPLWLGLRKDAGGLVERVGLEDLPIELPLPAAGSELSGTVMTGRGPLIYAASPVRDTEMRTSGTGSLCFGRFLGRSPLARIADRVQLAVGMAGKGEDAGRVVRGDGGQFCLVRDEGVLRRVTVPFGGETEAVALELAYRRSSAPAVAGLIMQTGMAYFATVILALILAFGQVRRIVLLPILRIAAHLERAAVGSAGAPLRLGNARGRRDEVGILADHVDELIEAALRRQEELQAANQELERRASTDALTGLANRRFFTERLDREQKRLVRERHGVTSGAMAFVVCDIDCFKLYNDHYGHSSGDACLKAVAETIRDSLQRPTDFACRHGGEEFLIMLPGTDEAGALHVAEKIRESVEGMGIPHETSLAAPVVTLSLGLAARDVDEYFDAQDLFRLADLALYQAKARGRNRVVAAGELPVDAGSGEAGESSGAQSS